MTPYIEISSLFIDYEIWKERERSSITSPTKLALIKIIWNPKKSAESVFLMLWHRTKIIIALTRVSNVLVDEQ